ncbi:WhiB family transcriptional regulator [Streptomyces polychromogenes]|uniref:Transcriptional regulator WhiB n=1 Tax=Streptomyces polychromogenes TaxID=67342 RepID=A0ABN0VCE7_9ACTN
MTTTEPRNLRSRGDHAWQDLAACRTTVRRPVDPELFFPEADQTDRIRRAKAFCGQCTVRPTCLDAALENGDRDGIRGGLTEEERDPLHGKFRDRLDYARVNAVLAGRDIHLTDAERKAVARAAFRDGMPPERLAWLLQITEEYADKLYRRSRRETRNRAMDRPGRPRLHVVTGQAADSDDQQDLGRAA